MWRVVGLRSLAGAAAAGSLQMKANQPTHAEGSHAPCCKIEKPVSGTPAAQAKWQWQVPDGEKPNHLAFYVPRDPGIFANAAVGSLATKLISHGSVEYSIILPKNFCKDRTEPYPLMISLHPAGRGADHLIDPAGAARTGRDIVGSRDVVWASFSGGPGNGFFDWHDGSQQWEKFFMEEFIPFVEQNYCCGGHRSRRYLTGICMGGIGALMYGCKHPDFFQAVAACQPAIFCAAEPQDLPDEDSAMFRSQDDVNKFGASSLKEVDPQWFREKLSPIAMAIDHADEIRDSGIQLFIDVGDEDCFHLHNAAELMHRTLWHLRIPHEYHLVRGANHMGSSWRRRGPEAIDFLFRAMESVLSPVEIMSREDQQWSLWAACGKKGPEPARPSVDFTNAGVFSDKNGVHVYNCQKANNQVRDLLSGPSERMGHPWRKPAPPSAA